MLYMHKKLAGRDPGSIILQPSLFTTQLLSCLPFQRSHSSPPLTKWPLYSLRKSRARTVSTLVRLLKGRHSDNFVVLITGTSLNGIGFETARVIAKHANLIIITGYNDERSVTHLLAGFTYVSALIQFKIEAL